MKPRLAPITDDDVPAVAVFLHRELNSRVPAATWAAAMVPPWPDQAPNRGFLLRAGDTVVGAYLGFYSERVVDGRVERFCNLGAWCVRPEHRFASLRLLQAMLGQKGYTFTDLSPSGDVVPLNVRLGFRDLDTTTAIIPNLPWPTVPGRFPVTSDPALVECALSGRELQIFRDHAAAAAARHLVVRDGNRLCYLVFRRVRRKDLTLFGALLYASDQELLRRALRPVTRHLLLRHGLPVTLAEAHVLGGRPWWSVLQPTPRRKMYKSSHLGPGQIDNLYSELVCVPW